MLYHSEFWSRVIVVLQNQSSVWPQFYKRYQVLHCSVFLCRLIGIGSKTALIALVIYALLPIVRNTYAGLTGVDESIIEAGRGMGMTPNQILKKIEFPIALPVIMAGIRTATVLTVGIATLATFVGAGGLGDVIYRGLQSYNNALVLAGALPVALLAIAFDFIPKMGREESNAKRIQQHRREINMKKGLGHRIISHLTLLLGACGGKDEIVISGKPWTEQFILPHILGQYIEAETDYKVKYKDGLGEVAIMTPALEKGDIDLYVEYTGTGLKDVLKRNRKPVRVLKACLNV